jgi:hypothetical protein
MEGQLEDIASLLKLACAAAVLIISHAERQQEVALDALSNYKLKPRPVLYDAAGVAPEPIQAADNPASD